MELKTSETQAQIGEHGERFLIEGENAFMRLWHEKNVPDKEFVSREYETLGYVISGSAVLTVGDEEVELGIGDSWRVPAGAKHRYTIKETLKAVEVCCEKSKK